MKRVLFILAVYFSGWAGLSAQSNLDSLRGVWEDTARPDSIRLKTLQALAWGMMKINLDSSLQLANLQLDFAQKTGNKMGEAKALYGLGSIYYFKSEFANSIFYYEKSMDIRMELGDSMGQAAIYSNIGLIFSSQGNNLKAIDHQLKSLKLYEELNDTSGLATSYNNLGLIYDAQKQREKALEYYLKSLALDEVLGQVNSMGLVYNNIGNVYLHSDSLTLALEYFQKSLEIRQETKDLLGIATSLTNLGSTNVKMKEYQEGRNYLIQAIEAFTRLGDRASLANVYFMLGDAAREEKKYGEAVKHCRLSLQIAEESRKLPVQQAACQCLSWAHKGMSNYEEALFFHEKLFDLTDSLKREETNLRLSQLEFEQEILTDSLAREEEKLTREVAYQKEIARKNRLRNIILGISMLVLVLAFLFLGQMLYFKRRAERLTLKTEKLEKEKLIQQVALLKTQVNPHFLFNSLSILSSLVRVNPDLSEKFIDQLGRSYRYILEQKDQSLVSLRTELGFIQSYTFLLTIRFENKFEVRIDLPEEIYDQYRIALLTLQLLVENAVKHNRMSMEEPLIVEIFKTGVENYLWVRNRIRPRNGTYTSTGIGLQNIINRYALLTDSPVWAGESDGHFIVKIPLLSNP